MRTGQIYICIHQYMNGYNIRVKVFDIIREKVFFTWLDSYFAGQDDYLEIIEFNQVFKLVNKKSKLPSWF